MSEVERIATIAFETGLAIHRAVGPGLLESAYETILAEKLRALGLHVDRQVPIDIEFEGIEIKEAYRLDLLVEQSLIIEIKAAERTLPVHSRQVLTYLKFSGVSLGFVMNFGMATFMEGVRRLVLNHPTSYSSSRLRANHSNAASQ